MEASGILKKAAKFDEILIKILKLIYISEENAVKILILVYEYIVLL